MDNVAIKDFSGNRVVMRTTEAGGIHTAHHILDGPVQISQMVDASGAITVGGSPQVAVPANAARKLLIVQNPNAAGEILYLEFNADATMSGNSLEFQPGEGYIFDMTVWTGSVSVIAFTTGHKYIMKEGY